MATKKNERKTVKMYPPRGLLSPSYNGRDALRGVDVDARDVKELGAAGWSQSPTFDPDKDKAAAKAERKRAAGTPPKKTDAAPVKAPAKGEEE